MTATSQQTQAQQQAQGNRSAGAPREAALVADSFVVMEGAGVPVRRVLPNRDATYRLVDPFLLLDEFRMDTFGDEGQSFPPHPHRGFEIITYMIAGSGSHRDSEGNAGQVRAGGLQRITTGRGIWHGEGGGEGPAGPVHGLQLWINLSQAQKRIAPGYQAVQAEEIPEAAIGDGQVRVLVGDGSPTTLQTPALYLDVTLPPNGATEIDVPEGYQGFAYVMDGDGAFGANRAAARATQIVVLGQGGAFSASAGQQGAHFVLAAARPYREPVRFNGPYVD
jgi:redox-sensitive bicupin YhaK (pirin superfamily)